MPSDIVASAETTLAGLPKTKPELYTTSDVVRIVEVGRKYDKPGVSDGLIVPADHCRA